MQRMAVAATCAEKRWMKEWPSRGAAVANMSSARAAMAMAWWVAGVAVGQGAGRRKGRRARRGVDASDLGCKFEEHESWYFRESTCNESVVVIHTVVMMMILG